MNGENIVHDYKFHVVQEPSEWAFNWDYAECGTSRPTPRAHHASMWLTMNDDDPLLALKNLLASFSKSLGTKLIVKSPTEAKEDDNYGMHLLTVIEKKTKDVLMEGEMEQMSEDGSFNDPNVGHYAFLKCKTKKGFEKMEFMRDNAVHGFLALVPHSEVELMNDGRYRIVAATGDGPDRNIAAIKDEDDRERNAFRAGLATRFTMYDGEEEVARCHMTYRDGSNDQSIGPTIEMLAVKQSRRGEGLAKVLWHYVQRFIEMNFTLECLNDDAPLGTIMVKASEITLAEVEMRMRKRDQSLVPLSFKHLLYDYFGFSVREQKGALAFMMASRRPKDEEAVLYIPLLSKQGLAIKAAIDSQKAPKPGDPFLRNKMGLRSCMYCSQVGMNLRRCTQCEVAVYCNANCQKSDWKRHKKWCNKSRDEVTEMMVQEGAMMKLEDGEYCLNMSYGQQMF